MKRILILCSFLFLISCFVKKEQTIGLDVDKERVLKELKMPNAEQLNTIKPQRYNWKLAHKKGICNNSNACSNYLYLQALYRKGLDEYFLDKLDLKKYDDLLAKSNLRFIKRANNRQNLYQQTSTFSLSYIYLRNNIYVERLDRKALGFLQSRINNHKFDVDEELIEIVRQTYPQIIKLFPEEKLPVKVLYSKDGKKIAWNNAVIFEIGHQIEFDVNGNFISRENEICKQTYLEKELILQLETEFCEKLNNPVTIFIESY